MKQLPKTIYVALEGEKGDEYMNAQSEPGAFIDGPNVAREVAVYELKERIVVEARVSTRPAARRKA
jgi:hypothetical protein